MERKPFEDGFWEAGAFVLSAGVANGGLVLGFIPMLPAGGCIFQSFLTGAYFFVDQTLGRIILFLSCRAGVERTPDQQKLAGSWAVRGFRLGSREELAALQAGRAGGTTERTGWRVPPPPPRGAHCWTGVGRTAGVPLPAKRRGVFNIRGRPPAN